MTRGIKSYGSAWEFSVFSVLVSRRVSPSPILDEERECTI